MKPHLFFEIAVELPPPEQEPQPAPNFTEPFHTSLHAGWITRAMACITFSNSEISAVSCLRPAGVSL